METQYQRLPETVKTHGAGFPEETAELACRTDHVAMYCRQGYIYGVFNVRAEESRMKFGKVYPAKEIYPGYEAFGDWAWCYPDRERAEQRYDELCQIYPGIPPNLTSKPESDTLIPLD